jgi:hypothetical protein
MPLAVDAKNDAVILHRAEDVSADPVAHGHAVFGVRRAVGRIVFAGPEQAGGGAFGDHRRGRVAGEVERHKELLEGIGPGREKVVAVGLDRPGLLRLRARDRGDRWLRVRHREGSGTAHGPVVGEVA